MKNYSNIYDIDGELIRAAGDTHKLTLKEAQDKAKYYTEKLKELDENDPKAKVYTTYIRNLTSYIISLYSKMKPEELESEAKEQEFNNQINKAINELKEEIEGEATEVEQPVGEQLVEREGSPETVMDEYVDYEEVE